MQPNDMPIYVPDLGDSSRSPMDHTEPGWWLITKADRLIAAYCPVYFRTADEVIADIRDRFNLNSDTDGETFPGGNAFLNPEVPGSDSNGFGSDFTIWRNGRCHLAAGEHDDNSLTTSTAPYLSDFVAPEVRLPRGWPTRGELIRSGRIAPVLSPNPLDVISDSRKPNGSRPKKRSTRP